MDLTQIGGGTLTVHSGRRTADQKFRPTDVQLSWMKLLATIYLDAQELHHNHMLTPSYLFCLPPSEPCWCRHCWCLHSCRSASIGLAAPEWVAARRWLVSLWCWPGPPPVWPRGSPDWSLLITHKPRHSCRIWTGHIAEPYKKTFLVFLKVIKIWVWMTSKEEVCEVSTGKTVMSAELDTCQVSTRRGTTRIKYRIKFNSMLIFTQMCESVYVCRRVCVYLWWGSSCSGVFPVASSCPCVCFGRHPIACEHCPAEVWALQ